MDPLTHYLNAGRVEGRATYAAIGTAFSGFDAQYYLKHNPDVAAAGVDPFVHFNVVGWREGRNPNALFDTAGYLAHYTDVRAAGINPLLVVSGNLPSTFLLAPVLAGALLLTAFCYVWHRGVRRQPWPRRWM